MAVSATDNVILDGLADPVFVVDRRGRLVYLNRAAESIFARAREELHGRRVSEALGGELDEGLLALLGRPAGELRPATLLSVRVGNAFWDVRVAPGPDYLAVNCIPALGQQMRWPEVVADSADAIWATDRDDRIIAWNRGAEEIFGYRYDEIVGEPVARLIPADLVAEREPERLRKALRELGSVRDYQTRRLTKDGRQVEVSLTSTLARNGVANGLASSTIVRDLSLRRQMERQMIESEKMVTLGQLAASVAQEIGAPLTTISIVMEKLRRQVEDEDAGRQLDTATQQLKRIARLSHGLVELAKPGELRLGEVRVGELIARALELLEPSLKRAGVEAELVGPEEPGEILGDWGQLQQVFLNLLMNAQRAMEPHGGRVKVSADRVRGLPVVGWPVRDFIRIEVSDDGPGIDPADLPYIFTPFFSRSGGSGLGLSLAKQIIHAHGGSIDARSVLGHGATFTIMLPVESDA